MPTVSEIPMRTPLMGSHAITLTTPGVTNLPRHSGVGRGASDSDAGTGIWITGVLFFGGAAGDNFQLAEAGGRLVLNLTVRSAPIGVVMPLMHPVRYNTAGTVVVAFSGTGPFNATLFYSVGA